MVVALAILALLVCLWDRRHSDGLSPGLSKTGDKQCLALFLSVLALMILLLYHRYIFGKFFLIYHDIGNDSKEQFYPNYIDKARRLAYYGWQGGWNPRNGMGASESSFSHRHNWFLLFGEDAIPYLLTVHQCLMVFCWSIMLSVLRTVYEDKMDPMGVSGRLCVFF